MGVSTPVTHCFILQADVTGPNYYSCLHMNMYIRKDCESVYFKSTVITFFSHNLTKGSLWVQEYSFKGCDVPERTLILVHAQSHATRLQRQFSKELPLVSLLLTAYLEKSQHSCSSTFNCICFKIKWEDNDTFCKLFAEMNSTTYLLGSLPWLHSLPVAWRLKASSWLYLSSKLHHLPTYLHCV